MLRMFGIASTSKHIFSTNSAPFCSDTTHINSEQDVCMYLMSASGHGCTLKTARHML
jgi:hypothetical protein